MLLQPAARRRAFLWAALSVVTPMAWFVGARVLSAQITRNPPRSVTGSVTDGGGSEPLRGAVVQIEAEDTMVIQSYVTDERGTYHFRNLRPDADYRIWATFRNHRSKTQEMNKFDRKADREISLSIDLTKD